jgi:hypothetical protein
LGKVTYIIVSATLILCSAIAASTAANAKDRPPEPLENPGDCPIDLPVRVASLDSLRHFEGLIGHCPETAIIESRATRASRPRAIRDLDGADPAAIPSWQIPPQPPIQETGLTLAGSVGRKPDAKRSARPAPSARVATSRDGSQIAIIQPDELLVDAPPRGLNPAPHSVSPSETDAVEAVLALRPRSYATAFDQHIASASRTHGVDPLLLHAVIKQESAYRASATSHAGARGLMQVMPATGRGLGVRDAALLYDPVTNIDAGARLLRQLWGTFDGNIDLVLAAYNAGEGAVRKYGNTVPPYNETRDYVAKVKANYRQLAAESGIAVDF